MTTMTLTNTGSLFRASRTAPLEAFQNFVPARPHTIGQAIQTAINGLEADGLLAPFSPEDVTPYARARAVLGLLADCYARQIYSSTAAARLAGCDPDFPWPWWEDLPDASVLRGFCKKNRGAIHRCLVAALRFLAEQKIMSGALTKVSSPQLAEEASRRIVMAAFADCTEPEGE